MNNREEHIHDLTNISNSTRTVDDEQNYVQNSKYVEH
jgi:hypothetical protein